MRRIQVPGQWVRKNMILVGLGLAACSGVPQLDDSEVPVLREWPLCDYERLGMVQAADGHEGHLSGQVWGAMGSEKAALAKLRWEALALGGDAVLLLNRVVTQREAGHGSIQKRPARLVTLTGIAIRNCR